MQKMTPTPAGQPVFRKDAENLYRLESSNGYYALLKRGGKQFRRSLKTKDRKRADSRLIALHAKIGGLKISDNAKLNFDKVGKSWLEMEEHDYRTSGNLFPTFHWESNDARNNSFVNSSSQFGCKPRVHHKCMLKNIRNGARFQGLQAKRN